MSFTGYAGPPRLSAILKAGLVCLAAAAFCLACLQLPQLRLFFVAQPARVPMDLTFTHVGGLKPGAPVRVAGLDVGEVRTVAFDRGEDNKPCLRVSTLVQQRALPFIRRDSVFTISTQGLLGDAYVNISFGSEAAPAVTPGETIRGRDPLLLEQTVQRLDEAVANLRKGGILMGKVFDAALAVHGFADATMKKLEGLKDLAPWAKKKAPDEKRSNAPAAGQGR